MYSTTKNYFLERPPLSTTGIPRLLVPQKVTLEYHRNPKIISTTKGHPWVLQQESQDYGLRSCDVELNKNKISKFTQWHLITLLLRTHILLRSFTGKLNDH